MFSSKDLFFTPTSGAYTVSKSLRFRSSATAYLNRTPASNGNTSKFTFSCWVKRGTIGSGIASPLFGAYNGTVSNATDDAILINGDTFTIWSKGGVTGSGGWYRNTTAVLRDPSAWYHLQVYFDTSQSTDATKLRMYINGVEQTAYSAAGTIAGFNYLNTTNPQRIGQDNGSGGPFYLDGYLAEVNFIDGQALTPSSFGAYDTNGVWQPIAYTGSYSGTNSFYLKFTTVGATSGSNTGYGQDFSGNGNYWTTNNFGTTSTATTYDSMLDSPTNAAGDIGNYPVLNPINGNSGTFSAANLQFVGPTNWSCVPSTILIPSTGKWFVAATLTGSASGNTSGGEYAYLGVAPPTVSKTAAYNSALGLWVGDTGWVYNFSATGSNSGSSFSVNNEVLVAVDRDANTYAIYKNGSSVATGTIGTTSGADLMFVYGSYSSSFGQMAINFGQRPLANAAPSGFSALNTQNLTTPTITNGAQNMAAVTYTGNGTASTSITASSTNSGNNPNSTTFQPDLVWIKSRSAATNNNLFDSVRTATNYLISNTTAANATNANTLTAFNSNGFTLGTDASSIGVNVNAATYVAWEWLANGSSTTSGTGTGGITSVSYSVNQTAGFSMVYYTGSGTNGTVTHGLSTAPNLIIGKKRSSTGSWQVYHSGISGMAGGYIIINGTSGFTSGTSTIWNNTAPNGTTFSLGTDTDLNASGATNVAYCWTPISGFSSFGSYTGNGSADGVFVYTGFRPRYLFMKRTDSSGTSWWQVDTSCNPYNVASGGLTLNTSDAESSGNTWCDFLSNGFKIRTSSVGVNASGGTYIYAAFAENPFKISRAR